MNATKICQDLSKIPIVGDFILGVGLATSLIAFSSAANYFGLEGESKQLLVNTFLLMGACYFIGMTSYKTYLWIQKTRLKKD
ncbi:MAG: hypothetical protein PHN38_08020 [Sulfurospirillaceae bacterium]|nr:hypothetical protein [Sulfurospirillaceae bacterium]MDD3462880.1 hypothetical protein [Sulfurospirillaceae bacterium]